ncbi:unnamed protein product [Amoebophrya sp. A25]|nr:unnamed protein product [Amoebophrya sp. A25]|eukprot:GSA25T00010552001.1
MDPNTDSSQHKSSTDARGGASGGGDSYQLSYRACFGLKSDVKHNVHFFEETQLVYPAGHTTVLLYDKSQRFFPGTDGTEEITCMAISPNKRYLAVAEKATKVEGDKPIVTIYDLQTCKKRKTCCYLDADCPAILCMAFDANSKFLLTQLGLSPSARHDYTLVSWQWEKAKAVAACKVGAPVCEISFNPVDSTTCLAIGENVFKFFKIQESEGLMRQIPYQLAKSRGPQTYFCHSWLLDDRLVVGLENGELLLFDNAGEFLEVVSKSEPQALKSIASFTKGFVTGGDLEVENLGLGSRILGILQIYEKVDEKSFHKAKEITLEAGGIRSMSISPSEESLCVTTSTGQLYKLSLISSELLNADDKSKSLFEPLLSGFHSGPVHGMDVCLRKPIVVTCGSDKTIRVWNYLERTCELTKQFTEEPLSLSLHPTGFHILVGFTDKLRAMNLLMDDLKTFKELPVKQCREVQYSNGGNYFAAANGTALQVYYTWTCELFYTFHGSLSRIRCISWSPDDSSLATGAVDGNLIEWNLLSQSKSHDFITKGVNYTSILFTQKEGGQQQAGGPVTARINTLYAAGTDRMLKEVRGGQVHSYQECGSTIGQIVGGEGALLCSVGDTERQGAPVRVYKYPLGNVEAPLQYAAHSAPSTRLRLTYDENYLFSVAEDGCLFMFEVRKKSAVGKVRKEKESVSVADEILVTRSFLNHKQGQLSALEKQVEDLLNQIEFQLSHRDSFHKEKMAELEERYGQEIEQERAKYDALLQEKNDMDGEYEDHVLQMEEIHQRQLQELESSFQHKMQVEGNRYSKLQSQREKEQVIWTTTLKELIDSHFKKMEGDGKALELLRVEESMLRQKIMAEKVDQEQEHRETLSQLETDADGEIETLKDHYEYKLAQEKEDKVRLRGQAGIHRKHHEDLKRQMQKKEAELKTHMEEARKKSDRIQQLVREREHNVKEIRERDKTIYDKEQKIYELKKQNQELEKFKFVLDYKIKELQTQINPKNDDIAAMKRDIQGMDGDLEEYHRKNKLLQQNITSLQSKQRGLMDEIHQQRKKLIASRGFSTMFLRELQQVASSEGDAKFREAYQKLSTKFLDMDPFDTALLGDADGSGSGVSGEGGQYTRQKEYLEKSIDGLKRALRKDSEKHRVGNMRILQEQVDLVAEINTLRKELAAYKREAEAALPPAAGGAGGGGTAPPAGDGATAENPLDASGMLAPSTSLELSEQPAA